MAAGSNDRHFADKVLVAKSPIKARRQCSCICLVQEFEDLVMLGLEPPVFAASALCLSSAQVAAQKQLLAQLLDLEEVSAANAPRRHREDLKQARISPEKFAASSLW